jgi:hypothetical protein
VVVVRSEIRAARRVGRVVKQLPVEVPLVLECEQLYSYVDARCRGGALHQNHQHSRPFVLNGPKQFFKCFAVHF